MKNLFKKWYIWIFILVIVIALLYFIIPKNNIQNTVLTKENYQSTIDEYANKYGQKDEYYYFSYALIYNITKDSLGNLFNSSEDDSVAYKNIYGKSIKQLVNEGKNLMHENNTTIDEYKKSINELKNNK